MENFTTHRVHNDLWQIFTNTLDWKLNYIHPDYDGYLTKTRPEFPQPCPDVYHFPLLSSEWNLLLFVEFNVNKCCGYFRVSRVYWPRDKSL